MKKLHRPGRVLLPLAIALWFIGGWLMSRQPTVGAADLAPDEAVRQAWELAGQSGRYQYRSTAEQTTYPAPAVANAGRPPRQERLALEGSIDVAAEKLEMTFWQDGSFDPQRGLSLRVEEGQAYGRRGQGEWQPMENNIAEAFAPGGDPLAFLAGAANVQAAGTEEREINGLTLSFSRYTFDINGPAFASYLLAQMQEHESKYGPVPAGVKLAPPEAYQRMTGSGELWLNAEGLPARLVVHLDIPDQPKEGERVSAELSHDYFGFDLARLEEARQSFWNNPSDWFAFRLPIVQGSIQAALPGVQLLTLFSLVLAVSLRYWRTRHFYVTVVVFVIVAMLFSPLLQGHHVLAYQERVNADQAAQAEQLEETEAQQEVAAALEEERTNWDAQQNPLEANSQIPNPNQEAYSVLRIPYSGMDNTQYAIGNTSSLAQIESVAADSDSDGLNDEDEVYWGTCAFTVGSAGYNGSADCSGVTNPTDSDRDGLSDDAEVHYLATYPTSVDTDGDSITDTLEVQGFTYRGTTWYLDPNNEDTNGDGIVDSGECDLFTGAANYNLANACRDTDSDGTPDFDDGDNDNDGVPDKYDGSPDYVSPVTYNDDTPFLLTVSNLAVGEPVLVDIQLRPTNSNHLDYYYHVLDWPLDNEGQIQRHLETTWATTSNSEYRSDAANAGNGDIRLLPMLEVIMPYSAGHYANLPVKSAYNGTSRTLGTPVDQWLDSNVTAPYSMSIDDTNLATGELVAYLPLSLATDEHDTPVAYSTRLIYQPSQASWGAAQQFRVVWLVQMLTDECIAWSDSAHTTCSQYQDTVQVIHSYEEEWTLTGLNVSEEHGTDVAILYERPNQDAELNFDSQLWTAGWNMGNTFLRGRDNNNDSQRDVRINNLASQVAAWNLNYTQVNVLPSYQHQGFLAQVMMTETVSILNSVFTPYANSTVPTLLIAQEYSGRSKNLDTYSGNISSGLVLDMAPATNPVAVQAALSWASYEYVNGAWANYDPVEYMEYLEQTLPLQTFFQPVDSSQAAQDEAEAKIIWAQTYYASLYKGLMAVVQADTSLLWKPSVVLPETEFDPIVPVNSTWGASTIAYEFAISYAVKKISVEAANQGMWATIKNNFKNQVDNTPQFTNANKGGIGGNLMAMAIVAIAIVGLAMIALGTIFKSEEVVRMGVILESIVTIIITIFYIVQAIQKIVTAVQTTTTLAAGLSAGLAAGRAFQGVGVIGFILGIIITWGAVGILILSKGLKGVSLGIALSLAIAATIVLFIYLVLDAIGLGFIVMIIVLIDAICALFGEKGPTQLLTEVIADTLYEVRYLIKNLDDSARLGIDLPEFAFADDEAGFTVQNSFVFTVAVTNTLRYNNDFSFSTLADKAVFRYFAQANEDPQHSGLVQGEMSGDWVNIGNHHARANQTLNITIPLGGIGTGIAQSLDGEFYVIEAYIAPYQGCWQFLGYDTDCSWYKVTGSSPINLGQELVYDILPNTLHAFAQMDWDDRLPQQADIDNDGLTESAGTDPSDDSDSDGDSLTDYYEIVYGLNPQSADGDGDGLNDAAELNYNTNPFGRDSDSDGVNDYIEAQQGWLVVYKNYGQSKLTRTWSNPNSSDADSDTLSDLEEFLFGFHPNVSSDPSDVLNLVQFDDLGVSEDGGMRLLAKFEESAGANVFFDSSGSGNNAACDRAAGRCPTPEQIGRYGNALLFDGSNDYLDSAAGVTSLAKADFTIGAWVRTSSSNSQPIVSKNDSDSSWESGEKSFYIGSDGRPTFVGFGNQYIRSTTAVNNGQWHYVAVVWDYSGSGTAGTGKMYVDGVDVTNASTNYAANNDDIAGNTLKIGRPNFGENSAHYNGYLDEVAVFGRALSADEIGRLAAGRYNPNDLIVRPDTELTYQATVTNSSSTTVAGFLSADSAYVEPPLAEPVIALSFEPDQQIAYFANSQGEENSITCLGDGTCPAAGINGAINNGVDFDGVNDYLTLPALDVSDQGFNVSFWLAVDSLPAAGQKAMVLDTESTATGALDVYINSSGKIVFEVVGDAQSPFVSNHTFSLGSWTHVSYNEGNIFINASQNTSNGYPSVRIGSGRLGNSLDGKQPLDGRIDELVYYDQSIDDGSNGGLSFNAIADIRNGNYTSDEIPRALYRFDELISYDGTIFYDSQINSNHATCSGNSCPALTGATGGYNNSGRAAIFDGSNDYLTQPGNYTASGPTLLLYVNPAAYPSAGNTAYLYDTQGVGSGTTLSFDLYLNPNGRLTLNYGSNSITYNSVIPLNSWSKVELVFSRFHNGSFWNYRVYLEVNDVQDSAYAGICAGSLNCVYTAWVGNGRIANNLAGTAPFNGMLDQLSLGIASISFDPPVTNLGYKNLASDLRAASCTSLFLCPTLTGSGHAGYATTFDGDDSLLVNQGINFFSSGKFTQAAWIYPTPDDMAFHGIMGYQASTPQQRAPSLYLFEQSRLHGGFGDGTNWNSFSTGSVLSLNAWNHVAATFDGTTYRVYVNGSEVYNTTAWAGRVPYPSTKYHIGRIDNYFEGRLDEIVILPEAATADGVQLLMNSTYPLIEIPALFETFSAAALTNLAVSGTAEVSPYASTSRHQFDQEVEAALVLQAQIDYPVVDDNAASLGLFLPFEEAPGSTTFENLIDYENGAEDLDATCSGTFCPTAGLRGQIDRAAHFDGVDDYFYINLFDVASSWRPEFRTFSAWVNAKQGTLFYGYVNSTQYVHLDMNELETRLSNTIRTTPLDLPRNEWFHLAIAIDSSDVSRVYVNGVQVITGTNDILAGDMEYFSIGSNVQGQDFLEGYLDDLRMYNATLTTAQIQNLYQKSAPVFRFEFDEEGEATAFTDNSVVGYSGQPSLATCNSLTIDSVQFLAYPPPRTGLSLKLQNSSDTALLLPVVTAGATYPTEASTVFCGSQFLQFTAINANGSTSSFGNSILAVNPSNVGQTFTDYNVFIAGGPNVAVTYTLGDELFYQPNPVPGSDGRIGNGVLYDGKGFVTVSNATVPLDLAQDFTIATWVKTTSTNVGLLVKSDGDSTWEVGEKAFYINSSGQPNFVGFGNNFIRSNTAVNDDQWHYVAVVWDRDSSGVSGVRKMYVDGVDVTASSNYNANNNDVAGHTLKIGGTNYNGGEAPNIFKGQLDEMVAYRRALSAAELYSIYLREVRWYRDRETSFIQVDTDAPTVQLLSDTTYWANGYIQLAVATSDPTSQVALVDFGLKPFSASATTWQGAPQCQDNGRSGVAWCPYFTAGGEGWYQVVFRAVDSVGNETTSPVYTLYVDNTPPTAAGSYSGQWASLATNDDEGLAWSVNLSGSLSDPNLNTTPAVAGSGVATNTVYVTLLDSAGGIIGEGAQQATATSSSWNIEYKLEGARPVGLYTIQLSLEDKVGNAATVTIGTIRFDERPPQADFRYWEVNSLVISNSVTLQGTASDQANWGGEVAQYHFEETNGYYDYSPNAKHASCTNCPVATAGFFGQGLSFDGVNDTLNTPYLFNPISGTFSVALWFRANSGGTGQRVLVQQADSGGTGRSLLYLRGDNVLASNLGGTPTGGSTVVTADTWHHAALTYDGTTVRIYLDGLLNGSASRTAESTTGGLHLGSNRGTSAFFPGRLDEVVVYDQPLTSHQIYALAQSNVAGVQSVEVALQPFDFTESNPVAPIWQAATVNNGLWSYGIPAGIENFYNIRLRSTDTFGNRGEDRIIWRGLIDTKNPVVSGSGQHIGGGSAAQTQYTFTFSDFILNPDSFNQPCATGALVNLNTINASLPHDGYPYQVTATCRVTGHQTSRNLTACDGVDRCTTITITPATGPAVASVAILTPTNRSSWQGLSPVSVNVGAYAPGGMNNITLRVNGTVINSHVPPAGMPDMIWTTNWQPTAAGTYTITAVMNSMVGAAEVGDGESAESTAGKEGAGEAIYTDTIVVTITAAPTAISLADLTIRQEVPILVFWLLLVLALVSLMAVLRRRRLKEK